MMTSISAPAWAQDTRAVGLVFGYPTSVGVIWQVSERIAIRSDVNYNWTSTEATSSSSFGSVLAGQTFTTTSISTSSQDTFGVGIAALYTVSHRERMRVYVSPRVSYSRTSLHTKTEVTVDLPPGALAPITLPAPREINSHGHAWTVSGSAGVQYQVGDPLGLFGEVGAGYSSNQPGIAQISDITARSFGVRSAVGVIWFF